VPERRRVRLGEAEPRERVLDAAQQLLLARQAAEHRAPRRQRERHVVEAEAGDLLDHVHFARDVARAPGRCGDGAVRRLEAEALEERALVVGRRCEADQRVGVPGCECDHRPRREAGVDVAVRDPPRVRQLEQELRREVRRRLREVRIHALDPPVLALRRHAEPLGGAEDRVRLEVRGLEQDVRRALADLGLGAAHDPGECYRVSLVSDEEVLDLERTLVAVERHQPLSRPRAAHDHAPVQRVEVEGVQRVAEREHDVVRHVHDVRDRPHARREQARFEPERRRPDPHVAEEPADVAWAALEVLDLDRHGLFRERSRDLVPRRGREGKVVERRDLPGDAVEGEEIRPVARRLDHEHLFGERQHVGERRSRLGPVVEQHDPAVVCAERDLVLGEDHPVGHLAAHLPPLEREPVRQHRPR
jgi:hypothetical protein